MIQCSTYTVFYALHKPQWSHSWDASTWLCCVVNNTIQYNIQPLLGNITYFTYITPLLASWIVEVIQIKSNIDNGINETACVI